MADAAFVQGTDQQAVRCPAGIAHTTRSRQTGLATDSMGYKPSRLTLQDAGLKMNSRRKI